MGTRSLTHIVDRKGVTLCTIYRQMDGYPEGMGRDLAKIVAGVTIINGFGEETLPTHANGMGCLAAYVVGKLKGAQIGSIYLREPDASNCGEEYVYRLFPGVGDTVQMQVHRADGTQLYDGRTSDFEVWLAEYLATE